MLEHNKLASLKSMTKVVQGRE